MKITHFIFKLKGVNPFILAIFFLISPLTSAYAACCAGHGGVASCNKATKQQICKDGTASPTCTCTAPVSTKKLESTKNKALTNKSNKTKSRWWSKSTTTTGTSAKGCCSRHGGIAHCNKSTHQRMCKDGSASPSCTCQ